MMCQRISHAHRLRWGFDVSGQLPAGRLCHELLLLLTIMATTKERAIEWKRNEAKRTIDQFIMAGRCGCNLFMATVAT